MTFEEKLRELKDMSLTLQRDFLKVVVEMRALINKGEALEESMLARRDDLYHKFNKVLNDHRHLTRYISTKNLFLDSEYHEPPEFF